jgi:dynein heavy chain
MRSISSFKAEDFDDNEPKTRAILFGLAHFHAILMERKKFGPMGYNMQYPFGLGDLRDGAICLANYMENAPSKIPWEDLQYIFGQIIWGGHIVNDNDRLLAMTVSSVCVWCVWCVCGVCGVCGVYLYSVLQW